MALSSVIRTASVIPLALRATASPRILVSSFNIKSPAAVCGGDITKRSSGFSHFSTVTTDTMRQVDRKVSKALKTQLKSLSKLLDIKMPTAPPGFPYEIEDNGDYFIKLKREYGGEKIEVYVYDPIYPPNSSDKNLEDEEEAKSFSWSKPRIQLTMNITKKSETVLRIYLWANVGYVGFSEIFIDPGSAHISYWECRDKEAYFREFIQARGIDDSIGKLMMDYMNKREDRKQYLFWEKVRDIMKD